ncbi:MAG: hypothetical protein ACRDTO_04075 [Mycobacterium sp.]
MTASSVLVGGLGVWLAVTLFMTPDGVGNGVGILIGTVLVQLFAWGTWLARHGSPKPKPVSRNPQAGQRPTSQAQVSNRR